MNYLRNNMTGSQYNFDSVPQNGNADALDYSSPFEVGGPGGGKGYRLKSDPMTVQLGDGRLVQLGVDVEATRKRNMENQKFNLGMEQGRVGIEGDRIKNKLLEAQIADLQGGSDAVPTRMLAQSMGVPSAPPDPLTGLSRKAREQFQTKMYSAGDKQVSVLEQDVRESGAMGQDAKRFKELNEKTATGPLIGSAPIGWIRKIADSDLQEMDSISSKIIPKLRQPGSGATSDFDARMFGKGTIGIDKDRKANNAIAEGLLAKSKQDFDRAEFMRTYLEANGSMRGAENSWSKYTSANPIFDPASSDVPKINESRVHWRKFFEGGQADQPGLQPNKNRPPLDAFQR